MPEIHVVSSEVGVGIRIGVQLMIVKNFNLKKLQKQKDAKYVDLNHAKMISVLIISQLEKVDENQHPLLQSRLPLPRGYLSAQLGHHALEGKISLFLVNVNF